MITFHNDHLLAPEFCKLIYDTVPEENHVPVVFTTLAKEYRGVLGQAHFGSAESPHIQINLQTIFYFYIPEKQNFGENYSKLHITIWTFCDTDAFRRANSSIRRIEEWQIIEGLANDYMNLAIIKLLEHDTRLCQPNRLVVFRWANRKKKG